MFFRAEGGFIEADSDLPAKNSTFQILEWIAGNGASFNLNV